MRSSKLINKRKKFFEPIIKNFKHDKINDLIVCSKIEPKIFQDLRESALDFYNISKKYNLSNMTPNGKLVPKKQTEKEYNKFVFNYYKTINSLNFSKKIRKIILPVLRFKEKKINILNQKRNSRSELPHTDAWAGWGSNSILIMIPINGDLKKNRVNFYEFPKNINKSWMRKQNFVTAQSFVKKFKKIKHHYKKGYIYIADISVLHCTKRLSGSKDRLSIDIPIMINGNYRISNFQKKDSIDLKKIALIKKKYLLKSALNMGEIDGESKKILPTTARLTKLS
tara:strand:+ start:1604 stop:2449 length:846 start_codon:yes stop_codon:yes gene_type:complete